MNSREANSVMAVSVLRYEGEWEWDGRGDKAFVRKKELFCAVDRCCASM